jgi:hypothetical protein
MVLYQNPHGPRYRSDQEIKEDPRNEAEVELQKMLIAQEIQSITEKHANSPNYRKALAIALAEQSMSRQPERLIEDTSARNPMDLI